MEIALVALQDGLLREADQGNLTLLVLLDPSATFDTVVHDILLDRLLGIGGLVLNCLQSFLSGQRQRVQLGETFSTHWILNYGLPQGSTIFPLIFKIYIKLMRSSAYLGLHAINMWITCSSISALNHLQQLPSSA